LFRNGGDAAKKTQPGEEMSIAFWMAFELLTEFLGRVYQGM